MAFWGDGYGMIDLSSVFAEGHGIEGEIIEFGRGNWAGKQHSSCVREHLSLWKSFEGRLLKIIEGEIKWLLQLDNVSDGFWYERSFEPFFDSRVIGSMKFSDLIGDPDDKGESPFDKQDNGGHLCKDIGSWSSKNSWFVKDFKIFLHATIGSL